MADRRKILKNAITRKCRSIERAHEIKWNAILSDLSQ